MNTREQRAQMWHSLRSDELPRSGRPHIDPGLSGVPSTIYWVSALRHVFTQPGVTRATARECFVAIAPRQHGQPRPNVLLWYVGLEVVAMHEGSAADAVCPSEERRAVLEHHAFRSLNIKLHNVNGLELVGCGEHGIQRASGDVGAKGASDLPAAHADARAARQKAIAAVALVAAHLARARRVRRSNRHWQHNDARVKQRRDTAGAGHRKAIS
eukprot:scaffold18269_cov71-Phaeocystis_antarctica.AAC.7